MCHSAPISTCILVIGICILQLTISSFTVKPGGREGRVTGQSGDANSHHHKRHMKNALVWCGPFQHPKQWRPVCNVGVPSTSNRDALETGPMATVTAPSLLHVPTSVSSIQ